MIRHSCEWFSVKCGKGKWSGGPNLSTIWNMQDATIKSTILENLFEKLTVTMQICRWSCKCSFHTHSHTYIYINPVGHCFIYFDLCKRSLHILVLILCKLNDHRRNQWGNKESFWDIMLCSLAKTTDILEEHVTFIFRAEEYTKQVDTDTRQVWDLRFWRILSSGMWCHIV
jgi:hypothetical protein